MKINSVYFLFYFFFALFYYFILLIAALWGTFSLMLAIKLCSAQLNHQDGAMTAGPHAARVTQTGSQKNSLECLHSSTKCFLL